MGRPGTNARAGPRNPKKKAPGPTMTNTWSLGMPSNERSPKPDAAIARRRAVGPRGPQQQTSAHAACRGRAFCRAGPRQQFIRAHRRAPPRIHTPLHATPTPPSLSLRAPGATSEMDGPEPCGFDPSLDVQREAVLTSSSCTATTPLDASKPGRTGGGSDSYTRFLHENPLRLLELRPPFEQEPRRVDNKLSQKATLATKGRKDVWLGSASSASPSPAGGLHQQSAQHVPSCRCWSPSAAPRCDSLKGVRRSRIQLFVVWRPSSSASSFVDRDAGDASAPASIRVQCDASLSLDSRLWRACIAPMRIRLFHSPLLRNGIPMLQCPR
jgi:hypothetical protein